MLSVCLLQAACLTVRRDLFDHYDDVAYIEQELRAIPLDLKIVQDRGVLWITDVKDDPAEQVRKYNDGIFSMYDRYRDIYPRGLVGGDIHVIFVYLKTSAEMKQYAWKITGGPQWGDHGHIHTDFIRLKRLRSRYYVCASEDTGSDAIFHEVGHVLNHRNLTYLPDWLDESLAKAIAPYDPSITLSVVSPDGRTSRRAINYYSCQLGRYLQDYPDFNMAALMRYVQRGNFICSRLTLARASDALCLVFKYLAENNKLADFIDRVEAGKKMDMQILENCLGKQEGQIRADYLQWLKANNYLPPQHF